MKFVAAVLAFTFLVAGDRAAAEDLFQSPSWANVAADQRAVQVGDILTVVVYQNAEARNAAQSTSRRRRTFEGALVAGATDETAALSLDGAFAGQGEVRRSESFVTQISVTVQNVLPSGDLLIAGEQRLHVNGEDTRVQVRGRVRPSDILSGNQILSSRIADAEISYDGRGFVSRSARGGLLHRLLNFLGLGA